MTKYITAIVVVVLSFCFTEKAYCGFLNNLKNNAQQAASEVANKTLTGASNSTVQQPATQENKTQAQAASGQNSNNASTQSQTPEVTKEDILMLMKKIKTNLTEDQIVRTAKSMIYTGNYPYEEFGYFLFLAGEGQFSKQDKERILKKQVGDPGSNWKSKIRSITVNAATMTVETDAMTYSGNNMVPDKIDYIFTKAGDGVVAFDSLQMASKGVNVGGDQGAMFFVQCMQCIEKFIDEGKHEQVW